MADTEYFDECPYCHNQPDRGLLSTWFRIYQCKECKALQCYRCMVEEKYCRRCGATDFEVAGEAH